MKELAISLSVGVFAALVVATGLATAIYAHLPVSHAVLAAIAALFAFAGTVAVLTHTHLTRTAPAQRSRPSAFSPLNEPPVMQFIAKFQDPEIATVPVTISPGSTATEIIARHPELKAPAEHADKAVLLTIRQGRKAYNPIDLKALFATLVQFPRFYHVLLMDGKDEFLAYFPVEAVKKEFLGKNGESQISKFVIDLFAAEKTGAAFEKKSDELRGIGGAARDDTIEDSADIRDAGKKMWLNPKVQTLVVLRKTKPFGALDKQSVLTLTATGAA